MTLQEKYLFNDFKHIPTRPEIDTWLGVLPALELKRFEEKIDLLEPSIIWAMHWYESMRGWGYRVSFRRHVVCALHFDKGFFIATFSIPADKEDGFLALKELTPDVRSCFAASKASIKSSFVSFPISKRRDTEAALAIARLKIGDIRLKTESPHHQETGV